MAPRLLLLMRHAQAATLAPGLGDEERPLTDAGRAEARRVGEEISRRGIDVQRVLCSSSVRTRETANLLELSSPVQQREAAIYNAGSDTIREAIGEVDPRVTTLLVVGHAPGIPTLAHQLADEKTSDPDALAAIRWGFPPATLVGIELDGSWEDPAPGRVLFTVRG